MAKSFGVNLRRRPASLTSVASQYKQEKGRFVKVNSEAPGGGTAQLPNSTASMCVKYGDTIYDAMVLFVVCPAHKKFTLSDINDRGLFLPVTPIKTSQKWMKMDSARGLVCKLLHHKDGPKPGNFDLITNSVLIDFLRLQMPHYYEYVTRAIVQVELTQEACEAKYCSDNDVVAWYPMDDKLAANIFKQALLGPEPLMREDFGSRPQLREKWPSATCWTSPWRTSCSATWAPAKRTFCSCTATFSRQDFVNDHCLICLLKLSFSLFQHVYPSEYMTQDAFKSYLKKAQLKLTSDTEALFRAFGFNQQDHLNFHEFILGLATVGSRGSRGSLSGAVTADATEAPSKSNEVAKKKAEFLFRFFAATSADYLTREELKKVSSVCKTHDSDLVDGHLPKSVFIEQVAKQINSSSGSEEAKSLIGIKSDVSQFARQRAYPATRRG